MGDRFDKLLQDPELRRIYERDRLLDSAASDIEHLLEAAGLNLSTLAKRIDMSEEKVARLLAGRLLFPLQYLADLAWALGYRL